MIREWLAIPRVLARMHRQNQTIVSQNVTMINAQRQFKEQVMALGAKTLEALSQLDDAIVKEADELKTAIAAAIEGSNVDGEVAAALLSRVDRIKAIVPDVVGTDPVDPVEPTEPVVEPTEPVVEPTEPVVETPDVDDLAPDEATSGDPA